MDVLIGPLFLLIDAVFEIYIIIILVEVVLSWLTAFNVVNPYNKLVAIIRTFTHALTEPLLRPIRGFLYRFIPNMGGIDLSPLVLLLLIYFLRNVLVRLYASIPA